MNFTVHELGDPPVYRAPNRRAVALYWGVLENGKVIAAFESANRADAYARRLNALTTERRR
jgi:hypothetical protein